MLTQKGWEGENGWENYPSDPTFKWEVKTPLEWTYCFGGELAYKITFSQNCLTLWEWQWYDTPEGHLVVLARIHLEKDFFPSAEFAQKLLCEHMATRWLSLV